jgi:hypothetical protein
MKPVFPVLIVALAPVPPFPIPQPPARPTSLYRKNLLPNGGAEATAGADSTPHWSIPKSLTDETFQAVEYGGVPGEFEVDWGKSRGLGARYFRLGTTGGTSPIPTVATNDEVDLTKLSKAINAGKVDFRAGGQFGGQEQVLAQLLLHFLDAKGQEISTVATEPVGWADHGSDVNRYAPRYVIGPVPRHTVKVQAEIQASPADAGGTACFDNLSLVLTPSKGK